MFTKIMYVAAAGVLAITPAAITAAQPQASAPATARTVKLEGPFLGFTQTQDRIQVRLKPAGSVEERKSRHQIAIRGANGESMTIDLKHGQTWASAELPEALAGAPEILVTVD